MSDKSCELWYHYGAGAGAAVLNRFIILHNANTHRDTKPQKDKTKLRILCSHINHRDDGKRDGRRARGKKMSRETI